MDSKQEHHTATLEFAAIVDTTSGEASPADKSRNRKITASSSPGQRETAFPIKQYHFALPSVTVSSDPKRAREKREREQRRCTAGCLFRWTLLGFAVGYCKEISGFMNGMVPQTVISAPHIKRDYTSIKSIHDLSTEKVKPKCFDGVVDCPCPDPLVPIETNKMEVFLINQQLTQSEKARNVDVVFLGDSITERWRGTGGGVRIPAAEGNEEIFESLFSKAHGGKYNGLALGVAGDTSPMLLWRLQNGELPANLNPSVFWVLIGTNDIGVKWCSPEMVVIGVIRNVEEILSQKPDSLVVLNALLPRSFNKDGYVAKSGPIKPSVWEDIKAINSELKMYATYRERVSFFDTKIFYKDPKAHSSKLQIDKELMPDLLHPSPAGYKRFGEEIVKKLDSLIPEQHR